MKKIILILLFPVIGSGVALGQSASEAEKLVQEGIAYHDKGDYEGAIGLYDKALALDKDNLYAIAEKAASLLSLGKYADAARYCELAFEKHPDDKGLKTVYVVYGNSLDGLKKTDKSIEAYNRGIRQFPDYYELYYNKGVSLTSIKKFDEAMPCFQKTAMLKPGYASVHNAISVLSNLDEKRIPALLACSRFLILEPKGKRAEICLQSLQQIVKGRVEKTGENSISISIAPDMVDDKKGKKKGRTDDFRSTDLILAMDAALDYDAKNSGKTPVEQFIRKFKTVCASLKETAAGNHGFYRDYYAPYFIEMADKDMVETFAHVVFTASDDPEVSVWLEAHEKETEKFYSWSSAFKWKSN